VAVRLSAALVALATVVVRLGTGESVGRGVSVIGATGVAKSSAAVVALGGRGVDVGWAVSVCATAIFKIAAAVPATSTF
jgi:hypothetical protein